MTAQVGGDDKPPHFAWDGVISQDAGLSILKPENQDERVTLGMGDSLT